MTNVKIRIEVNPNAESENLGDIQNQVDGIPSSENVSNVSVKITGDGLFQEIPSKSGGINGLSLAQGLVFDPNGYVDNANLKGGVLESTESPVEFIWGVVPSNGEYKVRLVFTDAKSLKDVIIYGDSVVNQFPIQATIDGNRVIYNDDLEWAISFDKESDTHIIEFTHWNTVNYNACISKIAVMLRYLEIDKNNGLKEIESTSQSSSDTSGLYYGSIENFGSIEIVDKSGELVEMIRDGVIDNSNTNLEVMANDKVIQTHISTDSSYDNNTKILSLDLGNRINSLDILKYKGYDYPNHSENLATLLFDVLSNLKYVLGTNELTEEEFKNILSEKYDSTQTLYEFLKSTEVEFPIIESNKTYRDVIDEFCLIAQMQMYIDDNGAIKFVSARPKVFDIENKPIHIPKGNMFSQLNYNLILKNKYDGVEATKTNVIKKDDYNTPIFTSEKIVFSGYDGLAQVPDLVTLNSPYYSTFIPYYVYIDNVYYSATLSIPKNENQNLEQVLSIRKSLADFDMAGNKVPKYNLTCTKLNNYDSATMPNTLSFTIFDNQISSVSGKLFYTLNEEVSSVRINPSHYIDGYGEIFVKDENKSEKISISEYDDNYVVSIEILIGQQKFIVTPLSSFAMYEAYIPKSLEYSIYGTRRTITFDQVQANTERIDFAKTKVSLNSSNLIQTDELINTIKSNILNDYKKGVSNANVTISCNNYFDVNGNKIVNWTNGEVPKVNQVVYFDNDLYADKSQRLWKIKGRTFRKTGVPMLDLELEEVKKRELRDCSWAEINEISENGNASERFTLGETKKFTLNDGQELTATIIAFNHDTKEDGNKAGITFAVTDLNKTSAMDTTDNGLYRDWGNSLIRKTFLPQLLNNFPTEIQSIIKPTNKVSIKRNIDSFENTIDKLWIFSNTELGDSSGNTKEKYNYFVDNLQNIVPITKKGWWLRGYYLVDEAGVTHFINFYKKGNMPNTAINGTNDPTQELNVIFGFCI